MRDAVAVLGVPAGADLQRHRYAHRGDDGLEDLRDQRLVAQQRRAARASADLLGRAAHVQVDDLRAALDAAGAPPAASTSGSPPASCTTRGSGSPVWSRRRRDFGVCHSRASDVSISEAASPAPRRRQRMRNGRSVTPAMGASTARDGSAYGPMRSISRAPWAHATAAALAQAGVDLEPDGLRSRIDEGDGGVDAFIGRQHRLAARAAA